MPHIIPFYAHRLSNVQLPQSLESVIDCKENFGTNLKMPVLVLTFTFFVLKVKKTPQKYRFHVMNWLNRRDLILIWNKETSQTRNWSPKRLLKVCSENKLLSYFIFVLFWSDVHQPILDICCIALVEEPEEAIPFSFICNKFWKIADQFKVAFGFCKNTREIKSSIIVLKPHLMTLLEIFKMFSLIEELILDLHKRALISIYSWKVSQRQGVNVFLYFYVFEYILTAKWGGWWANRG